MSKAKMRIIRGVSGSGKSTLAKSFGLFHVEADMFFMQNGQYNWHPSRIAHAHTWCKNQVTTAVENKMDIVVSNTFTQLWEFKDYLEIAEAHGYEVEVIRCTSDFGNVHGVPVEALERMKNRFEDYEGETLYEPQTSNISAE